MSIANALMDIPRAWARSSKDKIGSGGNSIGVLIVCPGEPVNCGSGDGASGSGAALQQGTGGGGTVKGTAGGHGSINGGGGGAFLHGTTYGGAALRGGGSMRGARVHGGALIPKGSGAFIGGSNAHAPINSSIDDGAAAGAALRVGGGAL